MNYEELKNLLKKYRLGQCSREELEIINQWYNSFDDEDEGTDLSDIPTLESVKWDMLDEINNRIDLAETANRNHLASRKSEKKLKFFTANNLVKIAAVIVFGVSFIYYLSYHNIIINDHTANAEENSSINELPSTIFLSDGTIVWLKGDSRLDYPDNFTGDTREVTLVGEAFFKVAKDEHKAFIIYSSRLTTRVLGTSFNIKAYENDDLSEVAVVTGKVSVSVKNEANEKGFKEIVLNPNQKAIYTRKSNSLKQARVKDTIVYDHMERRRLVFNETPLDEIIKLLNSSYGVNISLANPNLNNCLITAELSDETLEVSLLILTKAIGAEYEKSEKGILIKGKGCGVLN